MRVQRSIICERCYRAAWEVTPRLRIVPPSSDQVWRVIGRTEYNPEPHLLCEGATREEVMAVLVSIYGVRQNGHSCLRALLR